MAKDKKTQTIYQNSRGEALKVPTDEVKEREKRTGAISTQLVVVSDDEKDPFYFRTDN